ncbi:MAG: ABC transporter permease [Candidatus Rokubacteria bacterium 13_1_40CM_69_27]|nr:MAG: ABC transporter permease [Candidatus Rokubacteria bacterium 13_1_40CM_69_27]OLC33490.1 MAG: ABC transporter permease [Candidatus Rokubacteria bacterium 13_1_40CM_4_69_5]OLE39129.1 MAG: ABC transporter permease [Candidatus Rokubacteria bacterium 13_1_20CM_2_70_7]
MLALILPALVILVAFQIVPILIGANASFRSWSLFNPQKTFVGLANYRRILADPLFYGTVLPNTFLFMLASVSGGLLAGLGLATLINRRFRGQRLVRTAILLPLMVPPVVAAIMITWMFNDQFGIANVILEALGLEPVAWLVSRWTSLAIVIGTDIWLWTPWFTLLILAALQTLPVEPHEAARMDGAGPWQVFRNITLPLLRPVLMVCITIRTIDAFRVFDIVWTITKGGPARSTEVFSIYAYKQAFVYLNFDLGAAASMIGAGIIMVVGGVLYKVLSYVVEVSR